jgi:ABC-type sugar transport system ATPase subunit
VTAPVPDRTPLVELRGIVKSFPGVVALKGVDFDVLPGEVHCLVGENGAGKSTLIKVLAGSHQPDRGDLIVDGQRVTISDARGAQALGLAFIFQELDVVGTLTVADNLSLGREGTRWRWDRAAANLAARAHLAEVGLDVSPRTLMERLSPAERQLSLIARALSAEARVIVMDEPTAALTDRERERLFAVIAKQQARGIGIVYVSHRMDEIFRLGDRVTVFRDGERVSTQQVADTSRDEVVGRMVGRRLSSLYAHAKRAPGREVLRLEQVSGLGRVFDIDLTLREREVVGLAGLVGAGRTELTRLIFGADPLSGGRMYLDGEPYEPRGPAEAIAHGLGLVPEERKAQGIVAELTIRENISMVSSRRISRFGLVNRQADRRLAADYGRQLSIRAPTMERLVRFLSGGNQQKVVLAKWLASDARLLILDEPTRGVDVGAKAEIFRIVDGLASQGMAVLLISSELEEIAGFCDRALVMRRGRSAGILEGEAITIKSVMALAA